MSAATPVKVLCCWCGGLCSFQAPALPPLAVRSMTGPSRFLSNGAVTWLELCNEDGTDLLALLHASVSPTLPYYPGGNWRADFCVLLMLMGWCNLFHPRVRKVKATQHRPSAPQLLRASAAGAICTHVFSTALRHTLHTINNSVYFVLFLFLIELVELYRRHWDPVLVTLRDPQCWLVIIFNYTLFSLSQETVFLSLHLYFPGVSQQWINYMICRYTCMLLHLPFIMKHVSRSVRCLIIGL